MRWKYVLFKYDLKDSDITETDLQTQFHNLTILINLVLLLFYQHVVFMYLMFREFFAMQSYCTKTWKYAFLPLYRP